VSTVSPWISFALAADPIRPSGAPCRAVALLSKKRSKKKTGCGETCGCSLVVVLPLHGVQHEPGSLDEGSRARLIFTEAIVHFESPNSSQMGIAGSPLALRGWRGLAARIHVRRRCGRRRGRNKSQVCTKLESTTQSTLEHHKVESLARLDMQAE
jgi:hypothetical protein